MHCFALTVTDTGVASALTVTITDSVCHIALWSQHQCAADSLSVVSVCGLRFLSLFPANAHMRV